LAVDDAAAGLPSKELAREGALNLELGNELSKFDFEPITGLVGGQIPSNCAASVEISHVMQVPQIAFGCAVSIGTPGQYPYFARTHQMDFPLAFAAITKYSLGSALQSFGREMMISPPPVVWQSSRRFC
jgi:hypothetical protein